MAVLGAEVGKFSAEAGGRCSWLEIWVVTRVDRWIAHAQQHQVSVQRPAGIDIAVGSHECGPGQRVHRQQGKSRGSGREFGIGSRRKQTRIVEPVECLPVQSRHADAEVRMAQRGIGENRRDAVSKWAGRGHARRDVAGIARRLGGSLHLQAETANQEAAQCKVSRT